MKWFIFILFSIGFIVLGFWLVKLKRKAEQKRLEAYQEYIKKSKKDMGIKENINPCSNCGNQNIEIVCEGNKMYRKCTICGKKSFAIKRVGGRSMYRAKRAWNNENPIIRVK